MPESVDNGYPLPCVLSVGQYLKSFFHWNHVDGLVWWFTNSSTCNGITTLSVMTRWQWHVMWVFVLWIAYSDLLLERLSEYPAGPGLIRHYLVLRFQTVDEFEHLWEQVKPDSRSAELGIRSCLLRGGGHQIYCHIFNFSPFTSIAIIT